ncbi:MAG: hypothetical protein GX096_02805 [Clostridiales bacterium]|nr:hypothetical protein [Clostridiales bacterium]
MFQRDYIMRMIEMMGDLMRRISELLSALAQMKLLDDESRRHCGLPMEVLESLSSESLIDMLAETPRFFASELLYIRVTCIPDLAMEDADKLKLKCLRLLASLHEEGPLCELRCDRLMELKNELMPLLTSDDLMTCARFLFQAGEYAHMEDAIFQAIEQAPLELREEQGRYGLHLLELAATEDAGALAQARTSSEELVQSTWDLTHVLRSES